MTGCRERLLRTAAALALLAVAACSQQTLIDKLASPQDQATARQFIEELRRGQFAAIEAAADPSIRGPSLHPTLVRMADLIPRENASSVKVVGARTAYTTAGVAKNITFEYQFPGKLMLVSVVTREKSNALTLTGLHVAPETRSLGEQNGLQLAGKTPAQYLVLALAILFPLLTIYAFLVCLMTRMSRRKWAWALFALVGIGKLSLNWTTGEWQVMPLAFQLFSASAVSAPYGPWILGISFPIGAVVFLFKRKSLMEREVGPELTSGA